MPRLSPPIGSSLSPSTANSRPQFPTQPKEIIQDSKAGTFNIQVHFYGVSDDNKCRYALLWNDYPPEMMSVTPPQKILDNIAKGYDAPGKKVLSDKSVTLAGKTARELEVDVGGGEIHRVRLIIAENRLFQLMTYAPLASRALIPIYRNSSTDSLSG